MTATSSINFITRENCPVCHQKGQAIINTAYDHPRLMPWLTAPGRFADRIPINILENGRYIVRYCAACPTLYQEQILADSLLTDLYERWISPEFSKQLEETYYDTAPFRFLRSVGLIPAVITKPPTQTRVLDFGAGWGSWALAAKAMGYQVFVSELSPSRIAYCQSLGLNVIDLNLENLAEHRNAYDFIHTEQVFEHIPDPSFVMSALVKCLKSNGAFYVGVPIVKPLLKRVPKGLILDDLTDYELKLIAPFEHVNGFTMESLMSMAKECGLQPLRRRSQFVDFKRGIMTDLLAWISRPYRLINNIVFRRL